MLRDLNLKAVYRSEYDNLLEDFYIPVLSNSITYQRGVGFFSAAMLSYAAQGLSAFVKNDGRISLIFGGELELEDKLAIEQGYETKFIQEKLGKLIVATIENVDDSLFFRRLELLSWLVASGRLDIKVALKRQGMYHEKIGILTDSDNQQVVFQGSANESKNALLPDFNFESINVFPCWRPELADHFSPYLEGFERLWNNNSPNTLVVDFPDAAKDKLIKIAKRGRTPLTPSIERELWDKYIAKRDGRGPVISEFEGPRVPRLYKGDVFEIRPHQRRALEAWRAHNFRGIFAHATGAGKTLTAIYGLTRIFERTKRLFAVVVVPYINLADQWVAELRGFNISPIQCYGSKAGWHEQFSEFLTLYQTNAIPFVCIVVVNRTLQSPAFQQLLSQVPGDNLLWIGDECHHHSSLGLSRSLPAQAKHTLGLSATPKHYLNEDLTQRIVQYYGTVVDEYELRDAISDKVLTPYEYYPQLVHLTTDESEDYFELSDKIAQAFAKTNYADNDEDPYLAALLMARARLLGGARNKIEKLRELLTGNDPSPLTLFYCGDGSVEGEDLDESQRQVEVISSVLYKFGWKSSRFTSYETHEERRDILDQFRLGIIDAMVAIRCLDEGIDVPACRTAYILASARNPKQFIQRRGRILRRSPGKELAHIFDFIVHIPRQHSDSTDTERALVIRELERVAEFASLSVNHEHAVRVMRPILEEYDLAHLLV